MKNLIVLAGISVMLATTACAQKGKLAPEKVQTAFKAKFPMAEKVKWDKENEAEWEAEFELDEKEYSANFKTDGTWLETEHEISKAEVPAAVSAALKKDFAAYEIEEMEVSETTKGSFYEFELEKGKEKMEVAFDKTGKLVKKEVKKSEEKKD
jgi:uncharacterized membrane protein YkoI